MKTMTMPKQHDWILPSLAFIVFVIGGIVFKVDQRLPETVWDGRDLISGLDPKELTRIKISANSKSFSLMRQGEGFVIDSQNSAPVDPEKLNEVILRLGGAQIAQVSGGKSDWDKFNVSNKNAEVTLELFTRGEKAKWKLFLGKTVPGKSGRATRLDGKEEIFVTKDFLYIPHADTEFIAKEALRFSKDKIKGLEVIQNGQKLPDTAYVKEELLSSLESLRVKSHFRTGTLPTDIQDLVWDWQVQLLNENGVTYHVSWAKKDERWFAKAQAFTNQSIAENGPIIDIKVLTLKTEVDRFNQQKMPWIWELSEESVDKLTRGLMYGEKKKNYKISKK